METSYSKNEQEISSLCVLFYKIEVNFSANFFHRILKLYECYQSNLYLHPYSSYDQVPSDQEIFTSELIIEKLAAKFEKYSPLLKQTLIFKEPTIKFHPFTHFLVAPASQVTSLR